ncbi:hypothetical protein FH972_025085 [Carpinus fangiana]|uniref:Protein BNI4 n=1 Tax=Carpinus fangiana TaxID=176857 RepID=A0A5N6L0X1_9ROSI|nr:hypothetical protein FH972_025085 [Carpinus fangiana]
MVQMADVLQPFNPQNTPSGMLQTRPASADTFQTIMSQHNQPQHSRVSSAPRSFSGSHPNGTPTGYRPAAAAPTYAFKATPQLRSSSATQQPQPLASDGLSAGNRQRYPGPPSVSTTSSSSSSSAPTWSQQLFSKDDSILTSNFEVAPFTAGNNPFTGQTPRLPPLANPDAAIAKPSPERYRRGARRSDVGGPTIKTSEAPPAPMTGHAANSPTTIPKSSQFSYAQAAARQDGAPSASAAAVPVEEAVIAKEDAPKSPVSSMNRYRRRSQIGSNEEKIAAAESVNSGVPATKRPASSASQTAHGSAVRTDFSSGPARTFAEVARRTNGPSPLSRPMSQESQGQGNGSAGFQQSPAIAAMAALNDKETNSSVKHKLRRAFSFGSSADFKRVAEQDAAASRAAARKEQFSSELDEEQDAIARQQEASGLGHNIYSGQAGFAGSTDNLSISSTASSASMMLRKMGKGMKKGGRSIKGLFRPKSVVGVPAADGPAASVGPISFVTVEAEREKVNVNADPHTQVGGGTGFPRLERNSVDASRASHADSDDVRRSIVGGESERAEVLAAVKRGILKRTNTGSSTYSSNTGSTLVPGTAGMTQSNTSFERKGSPAPSDASSGGKRTGHRRTDSNILDGDDYFNVPRVGNGSTRSLPGTPGGLRNIKFSPRIAFHEVWSASDYDRRGDIATCNRLTPMLAQQIKEELNTFKMEMEVHELSKPHTHFF